MRLYFPVTLAGLAELWDRRELPVPTLALAVAVDDEDAEYEALQRISVEALSTPGRRIVLAAELGDPGTVETATDGSLQVRLSAALPLGAVVAVYADARGAEPAEDHELLWHATQEIPDLLQT